MEKLNKMTHAYNISKLKISMSFQIGFLNTTLISHWSDKWKASPQTLKSCCQKSYWSIIFAVYAVNVICDLRRELLFDLRVDYRGIVTNINGGNIVLKCFKTCSFVVVIRMLFKGYKNIY